MDIETTHTHKPVRDRRGADILSHPSGRGGGPDAAEIARALDGRRCGHSWIARCPAHEDREPSLSIGRGADGRTLVHCFAGCSQEAVLEALRRRGLWPEPDTPRASGRGAAGARSSSRRPTVGTARHAPPARPTSPPPAGPEADPGRERRIELAQKIWRKSVEIDDLWAALTYLRDRGIDIDLIDRDRLRAHPACPCRIGGGLSQLPCIVAPVNDARSGLVVGLWRIVLTPDRRKIARLGLGDIDGNASRLFPTVPGSPGMVPARARGLPVELNLDILGIAEGVEDALAARQLFGFPVWSALSAGNMRKLELPRRFQHVWIFADADEPGRKAAFTLCRRLRSEGRRCRVWEPEGAKDTNELLLREAAEEAAEGAA